MIKRFSGQDLFLIFLAVTVLCFIYTVLLVTGSKATSANEMEEQIIQASAKSIEEHTEQSYTFLVESKLQ